MGCSAGIENRSGVLPHPCHEGVSGDGVSALDRLDSGDRRGHRQGDPRCEQAKMRGGTVKRKPNILAGLMLWWSRTIFAGLVLWAFMLYMQNEWVMVKWPW